MDEINCSIAYLTLIRLIRPTTTETGQLVRSVRKIIKTSAKDAASVMGRNLGCDVSEDEGMRGGMQGKCRLEGCFRI